MVVAERVDRPVEPAADRWAALASRLRRGLARRPGLVRVLRGASMVWLAVSVVGLIVTWVRVDGWGDAVRPWFWGYVGLALLFVAARTKTVSWRFVAIAFGAGCVLALPIGWVEFRLADLLGLEVEFADGAVLLAGPVEETLKLVPLAAVLLLARRRVRGFAVVDFLLVGYAAGLGFQVVEDGLRPIVESQRTGVSLAELIPGGVPTTASYGLSWLPGAWQLQLDDHAYFAGHAVLSGLVAVGIGLAYRLRRRFGPLVLLIPVALLAMVVVDHVMMNYVASRPFGDVPTPDFPDIDRDNLPEGVEIPPVYWEHGAEVPSWVQSGWRAWGRGRFAAPMLTALLLVAMVLDVRRADRSLRWLPPLPVPPGVRRLRAWSARTGGVFGAIGHTVASTTHEAVLVGWSLGNAPAATSAYDQAMGEWRSSDGSRLRYDASTGMWLSTDRHGRTTASPERPKVVDGVVKDRRFRRWRVTLAYLRARRQRAHQLSPEGSTSVWTRVWWVVCIGVLVAGLVVLFDAVYGGRGDSGAFLAGLLNDLADWWDGLSVFEKTLLIVAVTGLLTFGVAGPLGLGWTFWGTFAVVDASSMVAEHGHGLADLVEDPNAAWDDYWDNFTWQQGAWDAWEIAAAVPGGQGAGNLADSWRSHIDDAADNMADDAARQTDNAVDNLADAPTRQADDAAQSATRAASPSRTTPSHTPDPTRRPTGVPEGIPRSADAETIRGITRQNEAADTLAQAGYEVEHRPRIAGSDKQPDYRIEGKVFDCTAPARDTSARSVWTTVKHKVKSEQAPRAVLHLDDSGLTIDQLRTQFRDWPISGLEEVLVVRGGEVIPLFP